MRDSSLFAEIDFSDAFFNFARVPHNEPGRPGLPDGPCLNGLF